MSSDAAGKTVRRFVAVTGMRRPGKLERAPTHLGTGAANPAPRRTKG